MTRAEQKDGSAAKETLINSITFGEFVEEELRRLRSQPGFTGYNPVVRSHFYNLYLPREAAHVSCLRASFRPGPGNPAFSTDLLLGVEKPIIIRTNLVSRKGRRAGPSRPIPHVFSLTLGELEDPTTIEDLLFFKPRYIRIAPNIEEAEKIGGWVIDPLVTQRIREYAAADVQRVRKYWSLRNAPFVARTEARRGLFTTRDIARSALGEKIPEAKIKLTMEDLEWLKAHMRACGLKVPTT